MEKHDTLFFKIIVVSLPFFNQFTTMPWNPAPTFSQCSCRMSLVLESRVLGARTWLQEWVKAKQSNGMPGRPTRATWAHILAAGPEAKDIRGEGGGSKIMASKVKTVLAATLIGGGAEGAPPSSTSYHQPHPYPHPSPRQCPRTPAAVIYRARWRTCA